MDAAGVGPAGPPTRASTLATAGPYGAATGTQIISFTGAATRTSRITRPAGGAVATRTQKALVATGSGGTACSRGPAITSPAAITFTDGATGIGTAARRGARPAGSVRRVTRSGAPTTAITPTVGNASVVYRVTGAVRPGSISLVTGTPTFLGATFSAAAATAKTGDAAVAVAAPAGSVTLAGTVTREDDD